MEWKLLQLVCETEDTEIKSENGVYSLTIHGVTTDMTGNIKCTAYNKVSLEIVRECVPRGERERGEGGG